MPHPGPVVRKQEFKGETSLLDQDFVRNLEVLVPSLFDRASVKMDPSGNVLTAADVVDYFTVWKNILKYFLNFFQKYTEIFQDEEMPETVTILEATAEANHHMAVQKATSLWKEKVESLVPEKPGYLSEKNFK